MAERAPEAQGMAAEAAAKAAARGQVDQAMAVVEATVQVMAVAWTAGVPVVSAHRRY